jgi:ubiquitin-activating enzyme E1
MLSQGSSMLFGFIRKPEELSRRLALPIADLVESVTKRAIAGHVRGLVLEGLAERVDSGEDVDIPYIRVAL